MKRRVGVVLAAGGLAVIGLLGFLLWLHDAAQRDMLARGEQVAR